MNICIAGLNRRAGYATAYRAVARAFMGGGGVYSCIRVLPDYFLFLKSVVF